MAIYTFECDNCGIYEHIMSPDNLPLKECPICGEPNPERIFQPINSKVLGGFGKSWMPSSDK